MREREKEKTETNKKRRKAKEKKRKEEIGREIVNVCIKCVWVREIECLGERERERMCMLERVRERESTFIFSDSLDWVQHLDFNCIMLTRLCEEREKREREKQEREGEGKKKRERERERNIRNESHSVFDCMCDIVNVCI